MNQWRGPTEWGNTAVRVVEHVLMVPVRKLFAPSEFGGYERSVEEWELPAMEAEIKMNDVMNVPGKPQAATTEEPAELKDVA